MSMPINVYKCKPDFFNNNNMPFYQAIYKGKKLDGYYFFFNDNGELKLVSFRKGWNKVRSNGLRSMCFKVLSNRVSGKSQYPKVSVVVETGRSLTIHLHQIVAQTFIEYPLPDGVTNEEWEKTPDSVKKQIDLYYWEANHIDHDHFNYHPSNLEWVSRGVNVQRYHEYY
jgi:hypothetical protein